ncbi:MAG: helix-turn-helix transcriptional regulator [Clostridia bacterium]|nr:helix-turn-helix transcriptional regulator [Clostridia bacterium]
MKRLKELREELNISQHLLAKAIGISQSNICEYEKGTVEATETVIIKLANYFDVSTDYLLGLEELDGRKLGNKTNDKNVNE